MSYPHASACIMPTFVYNVSINQVTKRNMTTITLELTNTEVKNLIASNKYDSVEAEYSHIDSEKGLVNKVMAIKW